MRVFNLACVGGRGSVNLVLLDHMKPITPPRRLRPEEAAIIRNALERTSLAAVEPQLLESVASLTVIGECECGCRSLYFRQPSADDYRVADGAGYLPNWDRVGLLVWAGPGIAALEVVEHAGFGQLPLPDSVCSWGHAEQRDASL